MAFSTALSSIAQLVFRYVMQHHDLVSVGAHDGWADFFNTVTQSDMFLLTVGIALYGVSMVVWIIVLSKFDVSFAYPIMSVSYVLVFLLAVCLPMFDESASPAKAAAVALIVAGVLLLSVDPANARSVDTDE